MTVMSILIQSMSRCVPGIGIYFSTIHYLRSKYETEKKRMVESILIGATARTVSVVTVIPFTVIKTRYEVGLQCQYVCTVLSPEILI